MDIPLLIYICMGAPIFYGVLKGLTTWVLKTENRVENRKRYGI